MGQHASGYPPLHTWYSDYEYFVNPGGCLNPSISGTITVKSKRPGTDLDDRGVLRPQLRVRFVGERQLRFRFLSPRLSGSVADEEDPL